MSLSQINKERVTRYRNENEPILLEYANNKRVAGLFNDVTVQAGSESIPANKMVLSCYCKFFETMFLSEFKEQYQDRVEVNQFDGKAVKAIVQYIYTGCIDIDSDNVMNLLAAADFLQMEDVKRFCFDFFESALTVDNCIDIIQASSLYRNPSRLKETYRLISNNFDLIVQGKKFENLSQSNLISLFQNLNPQTVQESLIYSAIIKWVQRDESREQNFTTLFLHLKLHQIPMQYLEEVVMKEPLVRNNSICLNAVIACFFQKFRDFTLNDAAVPVDRITNSRILCIGGFKKKSVLEIYNTSEQETYQGYPELPIELSFHCAVNSSDGIYCIGGLVNDDWKKSISNLYFMDLTATTVKWELLASMASKRDSFGAAIFDDKLVVAGGWNDNTCLKTVELYSIKQNVWSYISSMKHNRADHALVAADGCLFAIGGTSKNMDRLSSVERLNDLKENWENVRSMSTARADLSAIFCDGFIYALGGKSELCLLSSVEKYDIANNQWSLVREMNVQRHQHAACVLEGKIFVVGGKSAGKAIECYDPNTNKWTIVNEMEDKIHAHAIVAI